MKTAEVKAQVVQEKLSSVSDLLKKSWEIFNQAMSKFIWLQVLPGLFAIMPLAVVLSGWGIIQVMKPVAMVAGIINVGFGSLGIVALVFMVYFLILGSIAPYILLGDLRKERTFKDLVMAGQPYAKNFFLASLLVMLIGLGGIILLIIPAIYWMIQYGFTHLVVVFENLAPVDALKRSKSLVVGYWWPVFGRFCAIIAIQILMRLPASLGSDAVRSLTSFVISVISFVIAPVFMIYGYLIYKELVAIKSHA